MVAVSSVTKGTTCSGIYLTDWGSRVSGQYQWDVAGGFFGVDAVVSFPTQDSFPRPSNGGYQGRPAELSNELSAKANERHQVKPRTQPRFDTSGTAIL